MRPSAMRRSREDAGYLAAHGIEAGDDDRLGSIVDDDVYAGEGLEGADVAALAADDAALHLVRGQAHRGDGDLGGDLGGDALDSRDEDVAGLFLGAKLGFLLDLVDDELGVPLGLVLEALE